ncbi:unnamed protein product [marine sediment metagenome]|uniref:Tyr recombinase domain-containing protein n=1 Tax=marine sediment metagenome TaxID=412755 RepID=X1R258_9ZZZZ
MKTQTAVDYFLNSCQGRNLSPTTVDWYRAILRSFVKACPQLPRKPQQIEAFFASLTCSPETRHAYFRVLRVFFKFISERWKPRNPMAKVAAPRCPKKVMATLEPDELMRLLSSASTLRDRGVLTLLIDTGMRSGELVGLRQQDIKTDTVIVRGKSGEREVPISEETRRLLLGSIASDGKDEYVFHGHKGPLKYDGIYRIVRTHMRKSGIAGPKLGGHRIRHGFGKNYLVNGGDLRSLQELMGHASITTTEKYAALTLNDTIAKHHRFTPLRSAHAAAQGSFLDRIEAVKEAEKILKEAHHGS